MRNKPLDTKPSIGRFDLRRVNGSGSVDVVVLSNIGVRTVNKANSHLSSHILWELDMIRFTRAPLSIPDRTASFVRTIEDTVSSDGQPLFRFLLARGLYSLRDGIIRLLLNEETMSLLLKHEQLAIEKEHAVADQQFALAAQKRDEQYEVMATLHRLVPSQITVLPEHIIQLIRDLGFDGVLPSPT